MAGRPRNQLAKCDFQTLYLYNVLKLFKLVLLHSYGVSDTVNLSKCVSFVASNLS